MKKILLLTISISCLGFVACKKCKTCTTEVTQTQNSTGDPDIYVKTVTDYCGRDYDDAPEEAHVVNSENGETQTIIITCEEK